MAFLLLLKENLPEFLSVFISLNKAISWKSVKPFSLTIAKLKSISGKLNKNLPANARNIAKITEIIKIETLTVLDSFFTDVLTINFNNKYIMIKIISE